jgi:hypothetical protein
VTASTTNSVICNGQSTTLNGGGANTYSWTGGAINGVAFTPAASASYIVTGTNTLTGCTGTNAVNVTVNANPTVTAVSNASIICAGQSVTLTASGANSYTWNTSANGATIVDSPTTTVSYTVTGSNANGCTAIATIQQSVSACTAIEEQALANSFRLYPNPGHGLATLELNETANVIILNTLGQVISNEHLQAGQHTIDLSMQANGIYFVKVIGSRQQTIRLIKE